MKNCAFILKSVLRNCRKLHFKTLGFLCEHVRQPTIHMNKELCLEARGWKLFGRYPNAKIVWCDTFIVCLFVLGSTFQYFRLSSIIVLFHAFALQFCSKSDIGVRISLTQKLEHAKDWSCSEWMFSDVTTGLEHTDSFNRPAFRKQTIGGLKRLLLFVKMIVMLMQSCTQFQQTYFCRQTIDGWRDCCFSWKWSCH